MKIHLVDNTNQYDEIYEIPDNITYRELWREIEKIIDDKAYSCRAFTSPEIDKKDRTITIRWAELFGNLSIPYIEIVGYSETILEAFELCIRKCYKRKNRNKE